MRGLVLFICTLALSAIVTGFVRSFARRIGAVDRPADAPDRKIHRRPIPLLGGLAVFIAFFFVVWFVSRSWGVVTGNFVTTKQLLGIFIGGAILMIGGYLDDRYRLKPGLQIIFPVLASVAVIAAGIGIDVITNPFGGVIRLDTINFDVVTIDGVAYQFTLWSDLLTFGWLMGMTYTTKFLDGLDGLVSGVTTIGALAVFLLSIRPPVLQPETANLSLILAGACAGFLIWNFHPAKIFLGEGGSLLTGFLLGTLAIIAGSKIATALLIMGIPILDVVWVIFRRALAERRSPFKTADRKHLHFRLLDVGFSHRQAVLFLYGLTAIFSATTIIFHGRQKVVALVVLGLVMLGLGVGLVRKSHSNVTGRAK